MAAFFEKSFFLHVTGLISDVGHPAGFLVLKEFEVSRQKLHLKDGGIVLNSFCEVREAALVFIEQTQDRDAKVLMRRPTVLPGPFDGRSVLWGIGLTVELIAQAGDLQILGFEALFEFSYLSFFLSDFVFEVGHIGRCCGRNQLHVWRIAVPDS